MYIYEYMSSFDPGKLTHKLAMIRTRTHTQAEVAGHFPQKSLEL